MAFSAGRRSISYRRTLGRWLPQTAKKTLLRLTVDGEEIPERARDTAGSEKIEAPGMRRLLDLLRSSWENETPRASRRLGKKDLVPPARKPGVISGGVECWSMKTQEARGREPRRRRRLYLALDAARNGPSRAMRFVTLGGSIGVIASRRRCTNLVGATHA
jgi:hypothetical protein